MSINNVTTDILNDYVKSAYLDSNKTINQIAILFTKTLDKTVDEINEAFPEHRATIFTSKSKPITEDLIKATDKGHLIFLVVEDVLDNESYKLLEKIEKEGIIDQITQSGEIVQKKIPESQLIFMVGTREVLENQHGNLVNLGGNFLDLI